MSDTDNARILDKIRKCLALSKSSNEHEAAAALRQAQKMMAMHSLSEDDVGLVEYLSMQVITDYEFPKGKLKIYKTDEKVDVRLSTPMPRTVGSVVSLIIHAFGVSAIMERQLKQGPSSSELMIAVRYFGTRARVITAAHAHEVVYRACGRAWRKHLEANPHLTGRPGARAGFYYGWCAIVAGKVEEIAPSKDDEEKTRRKIDQHYGAAPDKAETNKRKVYKETIAAGIDAGKDFEIRRPIDQSKMRIEFDNQGE